VPVEELDYEIPPEGIAPDEVPAETPISVIPDITPYGPVDKEYEPWLEPVTPPAPPSGGTPSITPSPGAPGAPVPPVYPGVAPGGGLNPKNDNSLEAFKYLAMLGYNDVIWNLAEEHPKYDICDELQGRTFQVRWLIENAQHNPLSPIFTQSHPNCICYASCIGPASPADIPDGAPGIPDFASPDEAMKVKQSIFEGLVPMNVDSMTIPPESVKYSDIINTKKRYAKEQWKESIQPIMLNRNFTALLPLGFKRPLTKGLTGFQMEVGEKFIKVFLVKLRRIFRIPTPFASVAGLPSTNVVEPGKFVYIDDDTVGIVSRVMNDGKVFCYIPEFKSIVTVDEKTLLSR
jgi:hypothetical protein